MREIQHVANITISRIPIPSARDAAESQTKALADKIKQTVDAGNLERQAEIVERIMVEDYTSLEIAAALLKMQTESGT
jgi:ATP-dependent RNA helicase DeaD